MYILGVSCWYHDAAAALLKDGAIVACAEEERFTRIKHDFNFPEHAIAFCLQQAQITPDKIAYVVFYDKPFRKFERILTSILLHVPFSLKVFYRAIPLWLTEKLHFRKKVKKLLGISEDNVLFSSHHLSHAASAFFLSPFEESAILTVDGVGEWPTASLGIGKHNTIKILREMYFPHSVGLLYSAFTAFLGFEVNEGEYKVMGMAAYGTPQQALIEKIHKIVHIFDDGSLEFDLSYFSFPYSTTRMYTDRFTALFGESRDPEVLFYTENTMHFETDSTAVDPTELKKNKYYADVAASVQQVIEDILVKMASYLYLKTGIKNLSYAGGVALNSKANYRILKETPFENIFIQPAATDAGGALGAALWAWCQVLGNGKKEVLEHAYLGQSFSENEMRSAIEEKQLKYQRVQDTELFQKVAGYLAEGKVIGWYQGATEWGPRALGNRSILADPRQPRMKEIVNTKVKFREPFRPFAPSVLEEDITEYFDIETESPVQKFMLMTYPVRKEKRSVIPAVTHADGTARVQAVSKKSNSRYWQVIKAFKEVTGVGLVLNTSFNLKGEPIVNSPRDAICTYLNSGLDLLVLGNFIVFK